MNEREVAYRNKRLLSLWLPTRSDNSHSTALHFTVKTRASSPLIPSPPLQKNEGAHITASVPGRREPSLRMPLRDMRIYPISRHSPPLKIRMYVEVEHLLSDICSPDTWGWG